MGPLAPPTKRIHHELGRRGDVHPIEKGGEHPRQPEALREDPVLCSVPEATA
jgi:hypothetical protein